MTTVSAWTVGQPVIVHNVNARPAGSVQQGEIVKVGRALVTVKYGWGESRFRIDGGRKNDNYGHEWITTVEAYEDAVLRDAIKVRLAARGVRIEPRCDLTTDTLNAMAALLPVEDAP